MSDEKKVVLKHVIINFKDGDTIAIDVLDMVINQGFLTLFMPEDNFGNKTVQAYNIMDISDWEFVQNGDRKSVV